MMKLFRLIILSSLMLPAAAFTQAPDTIEAKEEKPKRICKRVTETGSFVKGKKVCMTRRQWTEAAERSQAIGREMQTLISTERGN